MEERVHNITRTRPPHSSLANTAVVLLPPINFIFKLLQSRATISVWLYENLGMRIEGKLRVRPNTVAVVAVTLTGDRASTSS